MTAEASASCLARPFCHIQSAGDSCFGIPSHRLQRLGRHSRRDYLNISFKGHGGTEFFRASELATHDACRSDQSKRIGEMHTRQPYRTSEAASLDLTRHPVRAEAHGASQRPASGYAPQPNHGRSPNCTAE